MSYIYFVGIYKKKKKNTDIKTNAAEKQNQE